MNRAMREMQRVYEAVLEELRLVPQDWADALKATQVIINVSPLNIMGKRKDGTLRTPSKIMAGLQLVRQNLKVDKKSTGETVSITGYRTLEIIEINELWLTFESMHKEVLKSVTTKILREIE